MKRCSVVVAREFENDVDQQLLWLDANGRSHWHDKLLDEVIAVSQLLQRFPQLGEADQPPHRRVLLRTLPFAVWYSFEPEAKRVTLLRLFHHRRYR